MTRFVEFLYIGVRDFYVSFIRDVNTRIPQAPEPDSQFPDVSSFKWSPPYNFGSLKCSKKPLRGNAMASE